MKSLSILLIALITLSSFTQKKKKKFEEINFKVAGVCGMCEERIEDALDVKGVRTAQWDIESENCKVVYNPDKISETEIHQLVADAGHDTDKIKATDETYNNLHHCCKYKEDVKH